MIITLCLLWRVTMFMRNFRKEHLKAFLLVHQIRKNCFLILATQREKSVVPKFSYWLKKTIVQCANPP